jgi:hypothetical protein
MFTLFDRRMAIVSALQHNIPLAVAVMFFLFLCTVVRPPQSNDWRSWVVATCWVLMLIMMLFQFVLR